LHIYHTKFEPNHRNDLSDHSFMVNFDFQRLLIRYADKVDLNLQCITVICPVNPIEVDHPIKGLMIQQYGFQSTKPNPIELHELHLLSGIPDHTIVLPL
jgi:hypothetical protein